MSSFQDWHIKERVSRIARAYQRAGHPVDLRPYTFEIDFGNLLAGASTPMPQIVSIPAEADFVWLGTSLFPHFEQGNAGGAPERPLSYFVRITLHKSFGTLGRHIRAAGDGDAEWIPLANIAGSGREPFFWPFPIISAGGDKIAWDAANLRNNAQTIRVTMHGVQLYRRLAVA